jgi:hypothetical protein
MPGAQNDVDVDPVVICLLEQSRKDFPGWVFETTCEGWKASKDGVVVHGPTLIQVRATIPAQPSAGHIEPRPTR